VNKSSPPCFFHFLDFFQEMKRISSSNLFIKLKLKVGINYHIFF